MQLTSLGSGHRSRYCKSGQRTPFKPTEYENNSRRENLRRWQGKMCDFKSLQSYDGFCLLEVQVANVGEQQGRVHIMVTTIQKLVVAAISLGRARCAF